MRCHSVGSHQLNEATGHPFSILFATVAAFIAFASPALSHPLITGRVFDSAGGNLEMNGAGIAIPTDALTTPTPITIERIAADQLPPLEPGMANVTSGGGGYRFLPHGTHFNRAVSIHVPVDDAVLQADVTVLTGARTYYWDEDHQRWRLLHRVSVDLTAKRLVSATTHFTIMINAILKTPDHPSPLQFNPNSIEDIAMGDPAANIDLIEPPRANNQGTAELSYPIRLPHGRGAFSPQLTLTYSSGRMNGPLGIGWGIEPPRIEIDTRWGVPIYDVAGNVESARYLLNGAALVPVDQDTIASCKALPGSVVDQQFATRVDSFQLIVRCTSPSGVHWEVTATDGTRFEYGIDVESRLSSYRPQLRGSHASRIFNVKFWSS